MLHGLNSQNQSKIYWERQQGDLMCGLHALNAILQGNYYDEITLSQVAIDLDKKEKEMYGGDIDGKSNNLNDGGYFSIQVLVEAMKKLGDFQLESLTSENNKTKNPK